MDCFQVSSVELGTFYTPIIGKVGTGDRYIHPAYTKPELPTVFLRSLVNSGQRLGADPKKAVERIYEFSLDSEPSLYFPLGKDSIQEIKEEIRRIEQDVTKHEARSEGLEFDA